MCIHQLQLFTRFLFTEASKGQTSSLKVALGCTIYLKPGATQTKCTWPQQSSLQKQSWKACVGLKYNQFPGFSVQLENCSLNYPGVLGFPVHMGTQKKACATQTSDKIPFRKIQIIKTFSRIINLNQSAKPEFKLDFLHYYWFWWNYRPRYYRFTTLLTLMTTV